MSQWDYGPKIWFPGIFGHAQSIGNCLDRKNPASSSTALVRLIGRKNRYLGLLTASTFHKSSFNLWKVEGKLGVFMCLRLKINNKIIFKTLQINSQKKTNMKQNEDNCFKKANNNYEFLIIVLDNFRPQQTIKATLKFIIFKALKTKQESKIWPNSDMPKNL